MSVIEPDAQEGNEVWGIWGSSTCTFRSNFANNHRWNAASLYKELAILTAWILYKRYHVHEHVFLWVKEMSIPDVRTVFEICVERASVHVMQVNA